MTSMLHRFPADDAGFEERLQRAQLDYVTALEAAARRSPRTTSASSGRTREPRGRAARAGPRAQPVPARPARRRPAPQPRRGAAAGQARAGRGPAPPSAVRHQPHVRARALHARAPDQRTTGPPLRVLDTTEDWQWWASCLATTYRAAGIGPGDRVALAFSFGPHVQFWDARDGLERVGAMSIALGGMSSVQRLQTIAQVEATAIMCTPSYALRLYEVAVEENLEGALDSVEKVICAGEPGASLPAVRRADRGVPGRARVRPRRPERDRPVRLPVRRGRRAAHQRRRVRLRDPRRRPAAGGAGHARRARPDAARPPRLAGAALPDRRRGDQLVGDVPGRPRAPVAARRDRRPDRRHGRHPRHERVPVGDRAGRCATRPTRASSGSPSTPSPAAWTRSSSRSSSGAARPPARCRT